MSLLATMPTEYEQYKLPMLQKQIEQALVTFSNNSALALAQGITAAWAGGQSLVTAPLAAAGMQVASSLPPLDTRMLMAISNFSTDRIKDVGKVAISKINSNLGMVMVGAQTPGEAISKVTEILGEESRDRAFTIVRTSISQSFAVATQQSMEQAEKFVPGLQKQWWRSKKIHSRANHDVIDGQVQPISEPFKLLAKKDDSLLFMMHPHDPTAPAGEVINCGCIAVPWKASWKVSNPGRAPYSELELKHSQTKRDLNEAANNPIKLAEAFDPRQARDAHGKWLKIGITTKLSGNELGFHPDTKALRKAAMAHAEQHLIGKLFTNTNSRHAIKVTRQGIKHSLAGANATELKLIPGLPLLQSTASYQGAFPDRLGRPHIKAAHKYLTQAKVGDEVLHIGIVTHEKHDGHEHYDHFIVSSK